MRNPTVSGKNSSYAQVLRFLEVVGSEGPGSLLCAPRDRSSREGGAWPSPTRIGGWSVGGLAADTIAIQDLLKQVLDKVATLQKRHDDKMQRASDIGEKVPGGNLGKRRVPLPAHVRAFVAASFAHGSFCH